MDFRETWWQEAVKFHGHSCPGLAIGVRIALDFLEELGLSRADDEELAAVAETDACGVDGLQVILGCTIGKGNLWLAKRGKHVYTIFARGVRRGRRYHWHGQGAAQESRPHKIRHYLTAPKEELYTLEPPRLELPPEAPVWPSLFCEKCGEATAEPNLRVREGRMVCLDCAGRPFRYASRLYESEVLP